MYASTLYTVDGTLPVAQVGADKKCCSTCLMLLELGSSSFELLCSVLFCY